MSNLPFELTEKECDWLCRLVASAHSAVPIEMGDDP